jgi:hypothetical protein
LIGLRENRANVHCTVGADDDISVGFGRDHFSNRDVFRGKRQIDGIDLKVIPIDEIFIELRVDGRQLRDTRVAMKTNRWLLTGLILNAALEIRRSISEFHVRRLTDIWLEWRQR